MTQSNLDPIYWHEANGNIVDLAARKEAKELFAADESLFHLFVNFVRAVRDTTDKAEATGNDRDQIWWHEQLPLAGAQWGDIIRARIKEARPGKNERVKLVELLAAALTSAGVTKPQIDALRNRLEGGHLDRDNLVQPE